MPKDLHTAIGDYAYYDVSYSNFDVLRNLLTIPFAIVLAKINISKFKFINTYFRKFINIKEKLISLEFKLCKNIHCDNRISDRLG